MSKWSKVLMCRIQKGASVDLVNCLPHVQVSTVAIFNPCKKQTKNLELCMSWDHPDEA